MTKDRSFFLYIMISILSAIIFRCLYLNVVWIDQHDTNAVVTYTLFTIPLPQVSNIWATAYINKYKLNLYYIQKWRKAENWVRWVVFICEILILTSPFVVDAFSCTKLEEYKLNYLYYTCCVLLFIYSMASFYVMYILTRRMNYG